MKERLALAALSAVLLSVANAQPADSAIEARISAVENGLLPAVVTEGALGTPNPKVDRPHEAIVKFTSQGQLCHSDRQHDSLMRINTFFGNPVALA
jgi:hypothetical protein